jgi:KAP family P-loop domain
MATKNINALSTNESDPDLINEGLVQKGLIGYISSTPLSGSINCIILKITFKNGTDYLYTTDIAKETLTNLEFKNAGSLGAVFTTRRPNTLRLYRFFHKGKLEHLLTTRPHRDELLSKGYRDETDGQPIYLFDRPTDDSLPVYFYTNSEYSPKEFVLKSGNTIRREAFSLQDAQNELVDILEDNFVNKDRYTIILDDQSIKVSINETLNNFYVNLQENKEYFTISSKPSASQNDYIRHDISSWINVVHEFQLWIDRVKSEPEPSRKIPDLNKAKGFRYLEGSTDFEFRNDNVNPVLNVETQASIFLKLIQSIKKSETGLLLGLFGRWGRGKTFFWKELKKKLAESKNVSYTTVEFHAWKYQDTPASWAYLYEQFVGCFYKKPRVFALINFSFLNRVKLNMKRLGWANLLIGIMYLVVGFIWVFFFDLQFKWNLIVSIVSAISVSTVLSIIIYYFSYSGRAKELFKTYWSEVSFKELLGIQAEIQKELRALMEAWISNKKVGQERLILFVDDIDRCNEDRIIQVIDSLKVMIDDPFISDRLIVIAAIDEAVLKRAIKSKYFESVNLDLNLDEGGKKAVLDSLCKEYMDKLFISGFKLGNLSDDQNEEIIRNLVKDKAFIETAASTPDQNGATGNQKSQTNGGTRNDSASGGNSRESGANSNDEYISFTPKAEFEIMGYELDFLVKAVRKFSNATPRAIRIYYYRYLLARFFKDIIIKNDSIIYDEWHSNQEGKTILPLLMIEYSTKKQHEELLNEIAKWEEASDEVADVVVLGESFKPSRTLYVSLLKIVEIVVPY